MGNVLSFFDGLKSALTGTGTRHDARSSMYYEGRPLTQHEIASAYSGSGLLRKIVQIPALDMVREWRDWKLESDDISAVENEEKRLAIRQKIKQVEVLRGMGGGALILGLPGNASEPAPATVGGNTLAFVHVVSRWHLGFENMQEDAREPGYGEPLMWKLEAGTGQQTIHPDRVIPFRADTTAALAMTAWSHEDQFWGESTVAQVLDAVKDSDTSRASFAALLHKARLLRIGIPKLMQTVATPNGEANVMARLSILATAESIHNATLFDAGGEEGKGGEEIKDAVYNFAGAKDVMNAFAEFVASISDIPATRLLGRAPEGLNSSGDSQQQDWNKRIRAMQQLDLDPCMERLDRHLVPSALGSTPDADAWYEWSPLDMPSEKERAERWKVQMEAAEKLQATASIPDQAFAKGMQSLMEGEGYMPGLSAALGELPEDIRFGIGLPDEPKGGDLISAGGGDDVLPASRAANDKKPGDE